MRYFWWAEFQKRGAIHYHMILVDAPFETEGEARRWFTRHWTDELGERLARIDAWVEWHSGDWFRKRGGDYVLKDVRKLNGKRYEQDYTRMPRGWRTFRSHQLHWPVEVHMEHETKVWTVCTAADGRAFSARQREIWIYRIDHHVPQAGGCRLPARLARARRRSKAGTTILMSSSGTQVASAGFQRGTSPGERPGAGYASGALSGPEARAPA